MEIYKEKVLMREGEHGNIQRKSVDEGRKVCKYTKEKCDEGGRVWKYTKEKC